MQALTFVFAFVAVLALIGVAAWLVRRFASNRLGANPNRGRMPRLAVIDAAAVDGRRRLVLVRRDNIEHLLMIGGPTDIVVESNIVRAMPGRDQLPQRPAVASPEPRIAPLPDASNWSDADNGRGEPFEHAEPQMPEPPPRQVRPSFADEARRPPPPAERRIDRDPLSGFTPEPLGGRPEPRPEPRMPSRGEPLMPRPRPSEAPKPPIRAPERVTMPPPPPPRLRRHPLRRQLPRCRRRTKIWPRWRNGWKQRFAVRPASRLRRRSRPNRRLLARPRAANPPWLHRCRRRHRRADLRTLKTRWRPCWAVRRTLREAGGPPA